MPQFSDRIDNFVVGDTLKVQRFFDGLPIGVTVTKGWLTIKRSPLDTDGSAIALLVVTTTPSATGAILNDGAGNQVAWLEFDLAPAVTVLLDREYDFEIQLLLSDDTVNTPIQGKIKGRKQLTQATS